VGSIFLKVKWSKLYRNIFAVIVLISYWYTYGKLISPEIGLNFLTTVITLKLLEKETSRDQYMIFFGLILLTATGALFDRTLTYVIFFCGSFMLLMKDFYKRHELGLNLKDFGFTLLWLVPFISVLFFFVPRTMNPMALGQDGAGPGEVGYTSALNLMGDIGLNTSTRPAFTAVTSRLLNQDQLYWRGNTISLSDGWNWMLGPQDKPVPRKTAAQGKEKETGALKQSIRLLNREDFLFVLDQPQGVSVNGIHYDLGRLKSFPQSPWRWVQRYDATSVPGKGIEDHDVPEGSTQVNLPQPTKEWISRTFKGETLTAISEEVRGYFKEQAFAYSLTPGRVESLKDFMELKKIGFCGHYASALALILRAKHIPARIVSGYMGGTYNPYGGFYLISQNDAHAWVEAYSHGQWFRLDPTEWIVPMRVQLGGDAFVTSSAGDAYLRPWKFFGQAKNIYHWVAQWDFRFYQWLEQIDHHGQQVFFKKINFKREWFYYLAPILLGLFAVLYAWSIQRKKSLAPISDVERSWFTFLKLMRRQGLELPLHSLREADAFFHALEHPEKEKLWGLWKLLVKHTYEKEHDVKELKDRGL